MDYFYDKNYILNYYNNVFKTNKGQAKFWDNIESEMIPYVFSSNTSDAKIQIKKSLESNISLYDGIVQRPNYNNYNNYNSNSNQYQSQNKQQYSKRFDNNQVTNQNDHENSDKFFRSNNTNHKSKCFENYNHNDESNNNYNTYNNQLKKFEKLVISTNNTNSLLKDTSFTIKGIPQKQVVVKNEVTPVINLESSKERIIIENYTKENFINFDNISNFCLILGFGNFTPFIYIKPSNKYLIKLRKEYSEIETMKSITTNEDYAMFGPFNVLDLKSLYKKQLIDSSVLVKLVESLKFKSRKTQMFELSEFNDLNKVILGVELDNNILKLGEKLQLSQKNILLKEEESKKLEILKAPENNKDLVNKNETKINDKQNIKVENENNDTELKSEIKEVKLNASSNTGPSQTAVIKKKKKARELDIQIGFYLMSKEESTYTQHYTAK